MLSVEGLYTSEVFSFIKIVVTKCNNNFKDYLNGKSWKPVECPLE